jgi:hypothetical protein
MMLNRLIIVLLANVGVSQKIRHKNGLTIVEIHNYHILAKYSLPCMCVCDCHKERYAVYIQCIKNSEAFGGLRKEKSQLSH